jgi:hypothetical protein
VTSTEDAQGFFDSLAFTPARPTSARAPSWPTWRRPEVVLPGVAVGERVLARTNRAAVELGCIWGYPNGFEVEINVRLRRIEPGVQMPDQHLLTLCHRARLRGEAPPKHIPDDFLRFGVLYADGRAASNMDPRALPPTDVEPDTPILVPVLISGGGPLRRLDMRYWICPLPPQGQLTFVCEWPIHEISETRTEIDAQPILDAADRSIKLWSEEPSSPDELTHRLA